MVIYKLCPLPISQKRKNAAEHTGFGRVPVRLEGGMFWRGGAPKEGRALPFDYYMALSLKNRLKKNIDFLRVLRGKTKKFEAAFGMVAVAERRSSAACFGFAVSKKVSSRSTARNLLKRRVSEWVRKNLFLFRGGFDAVFVFKHEALSLSRRALYGELERVCKNAGLFKR